MTRAEGFTRRRFTALAGGTIASFAFGGACSDSEPQAADGRIPARPRAPAKPAVAGPLGLGGARDAILQLPKEATGPVPLLVLLHGAGGSAAGILRRLGSFAAEAGIAVLAPDSRGSSWDAIGGSIGPDVTFLDRALNKVFDTTAVDAARVSIGGFSDGASYGISIGLFNGDLFSRVLAFSPGFFVGGVAHGKPRFFISHGTADQVLPIDRCSRIIVPALQKRAYEVTFRQFDGGHEIPPNIAREGMRWLNP
jgi:phospholipase/carboxylesterase